jgi:hypothetical protein
MSGLTSRRLFLNEGREFRFGADAKAETVSHMSIAYAQIDGGPAGLLPEGDLKPQITRTVLYREDRIALHDRDGGAEGLTGQSVSANFSEPNRRGHSA